MKTLKLIIAGFLLFISSNSQAQVAVNVNIGTPPAWGPVGYSNVEFYYLPDIECYFDIHLSQFIYFNNGRWVRTKYLPRPYRNYDLYNGYKVVLTDYHGKTPYKYFKTHKAKYYKGYKGKPQKTIGNRQDYYHSNKNHKSDKKQHHGNNGHGNGNKKH
ncbi:hypothetical protein [Flavobacterium daejeonense]|uniref:hypothetical protein n=1 Tax=Flavobacterium daejeonense TaxID=350893 RepID=UPI00047EC393|nr:hypothetical protein [Flavobacterium daejeonense]